MSLESFGFIKDLVPTNPASTDPKSQGDNHLRGIKQTLQNQFPAFTGKAVTATEDDLNAAKANTAAAAAAASAAQTTADQAKSAASAAQGTADSAKADAASANTNAEARVARHGDDMTGSLRMRSPDGYALFATASGEDPFGTNYGRFELKVEAARVYLGTVSGGGGVNRSLHLVVNSTTRIDIQTNGAFTFYNEVGTPVAFIGRDGNFSCRGNITAFQPL